MNMNYTAEELAFRDEVRAFLDEKLPADIAAKVKGFPPSIQRRPPTLAKDSHSAGLVRHALAGRIRRCGVVAHSEAHLG